MENYSPNTAFTHLKSQSSKFKVFCTCIGTHVMHGTRSTGPKKLFHVSIYYTSSSVGHLDGQQLLASGFECSYSTWIAEYCGKGAWLFHPCKKQLHMDLRTLASHFQT